LSITVVENIVGGVFIDIKDIKKLLSCCPNQQFTPSIDVVENIVRGVSIDIKDIKKLLTCCPNQQPSIDVVEILLRTVGRQGKRVGTWQVGKEVQDTSEGAMQHRTPLPQLRCFTIVSVVTGGGV
jgi:hypothetical protein